MIKKEVKMKDKKQKYTKKTIQENSASKKKKIVNN